jgi:predicted peptidase
MQLVREIEVGMDVDGDADADLDASRIYHFGPSGGGYQGAMLLAVEPSVRAGVLNVPGYDDEVGRLSPGRGGVASARRSSLVFHH